MIKIIFKTFISLLIFLICESGIRQWDLINNYWYDGLKQSHQKNPIKYIFVGSSRVSAAIDTDIANNDEYFIRGSDGAFFNMGQGHSTLIEHYFGLRNFLSTNTNKSSYPVILIEALNGLPDSITWNDRWYNPSQPQLLIDLLSFNDLYSLWKGQHLLETKFFITTRFLFSFSKLITFQERIRDGILTHLQSLFFKIFYPLNYKNNSDLSVNGGIRTDVEGIERIKKLMIKNKYSPISYPNIPTDWEKTVFYHIIKLVKQYQGTVILFDVPLSSYDSHLLNNPMRVKDTEKFRSLLAQWGVSFFPNTLITSDQDFPDLLHLKSSRKKEFTNQMLEQLKPLTYDRTRTNTP